MKQPVRCRYVGECYLAEELRCYGYMTDCPLYMRCNDEPCNDARFDAAMDRLIARTKAKHDRLKGVASKPGAEANQQTKSKPESRTESESVIRTKSQPAE